MWSFIVFLGFLLTLSPEVLQAQDASQSTWSVMKEWSGEEPSTTIETERFTTASRTFRISWNATPLREKTGGVVDVSVRDAEGEVLVLGANLQGTGTFDVTSEPGVHSLEIRSSDVRWRVAVEQQ